MIFIDTNIFLRYFVVEDEITHKKIEQLFTEIINGNIIAISTSLVIAEIVWVLKKIYNWSKEEICKNVELILRTPNIRFKERVILIDALNIFKKKNIDFIDAYNYSFMRASSADKIYSFDRDFDKFTDINRLEP